MDQCLQNNVEDTGIMPSGIAKWEKLEPGSDIKKKRNAMFRKVSGNRVTGQALRTGVR